MTSSGKNGLNIRTNASPKWDRRYPYYYFSARPPSFDLILFAKSLKGWSGFSVTLGYTDMKLVSLDR